MGFKIHEVRLGDICAFRAGSAFPRDNQGKTKGDHPFIKVSDMNAPENSWIISRANNWISSSEAHDLKAKLQPKGATVFAKIGEALKADRTRLLSRPTLIDNNMMAAVPKESIDPLYLYYLITSLKLSKWAEGSALPYLKQKVLGDIVVRIPVHVEDQQRTSSILELIDRKIRINQRTNDYLAEMGTALFNNVAPQSNAPNAALSDIAEITMGQSPSGSSYNEEGSGEVFYQGRAEFGSFFPRRRLFTTEPKRMAQEGDTLMSVRAPVGDLNIANEKCCIGRGLAAIHSDTFQSFTHYLLRGQSRQLDAFNGDGTVFGSINGKALRALPIYLPTEKEINEIETELKSLDAMIRNNDDEIRLLEQLRDTLLPKLMAGEIDVSEINFLQS